jgi:FkbM family methyltransferase
MVVSNLVQRVYDKVLYGYSNRNGRLKSKFYEKMFNFIKQKMGDPLVNCQIGGFQILVPYSHQLPFILKLYNQYSSNLPRIAKIVQKEKYEDLKFIDIGANVGDTVALLRKEAEFPILCIEGEEQFFSILEKNATKFDQVDIVKVYLGEENQDIGVDVEKIGGTAHLNQKEGGNNSVAIRKLSEVLKTKPSFLKSKMLKTDTDGFEGKVLRGAIDFLAAAKPVIFLEYAPDYLLLQNEDGLSIFKTLETLGYKNLLVYENVGDFMFSTSVDNVRQLEEINLYFTAHQRNAYCDICVFHSEDDDLFEKVRKSEIEFSSKLKSHALELKMNNM